MEANPVRIIQYFDGEKQSIIPLFQRPYTWEKPNWKTLWEDILANYDPENSPTHFMGAVVSIPAKTVPVGVTKHLIIDGQQRLTTVALLLCALRDTIDDEKIKAQIHDYLTNRHYKDSADYLKLLPTQGDREVYRLIVEQKPVDAIAHKMYESYEYFKEQLKDFVVEGEKVELNQILDIIKRSLQVVMINLGETDDPYLIFESLNFKGEPLTQADLVRNYILMQFKHSLGSGGEQERIYREIWQPLEERLGEKNLDEFLRHYASTTRDNVKRPNVYKAIKDRFMNLKPGGKLEFELDEIAQHSIYYQRFIHPRFEQRQRIRKRLEALSKMEVSIAYPLLLRLFRANELHQFDDNVLEKCLAILESLILRRTVVDEKRSALNKLFLRLSRQLPSEGSASDWLIQELSKTVRSERWPNNEEFEKSIIEGTLYGTKGIKLLLEGLEVLLAGKELLNLDDSNITIEHIMPQTLTDEWRDMLGPNHEEVHRKWLHTAGNLTLTAYNSEIGNLPFDEKRKVFANSGIAMNRLIARYETWGEVQIQARARELANLAKEFWIYPTST